MRSRILGFPLALVPLLGVGLLAAQTDVSAPPPPAAAPAPVKTAVASPARASGPTDVAGLLLGLKRQEEQTQKFLDELGTESRQAQARTVARGRAYVKRARAGFLPVGGGFEELVEHATSLERLRKSLERDLALERKILARRKQLSTQLTDLRARRAPLEAQARAMARSRAALLAQRDRSLAFARAFGQSRGDHTAVYGGSPAAAAAPVASGFAALEGQLPLLVSGRVEVKPATLAGSGPGLRMIAPVGEPVIAPYRGRVAFAGAYGDFGNAVLVDHGDRYLTLSANLQTIAVRAGESVAAGDRLGTVGAGNPESYVYVEVRRGAETLPPGPWFGI